MLDTRFRRLIAVTLEAAGPFGPALGGDNALAVHGMVRDTRGSKTIDVVTSSPLGAKGGRAVERALKRDGNTLERQHAGPEMERIYHGAKRGTFQWSVRRPEPHDHPPIGGVTKYTCQKCWGDRGHVGVNQAPRSLEPVETPLGPVLHPEDAAGAKVSDLARRGQPRDYVKVADLMEHYDTPALIGFARQADPTLRDQDISGLAHRLDVIPPAAWTWQMNYSPKEVSEVTERFAGWPRDAREVSTVKARDQGREQAERERAQPEPGRAAETRSRADSRAARGSTAARATVSPAGRREPAREEREIGG